MREHSSWNPTAYGRYAGERSRPFADLVAHYLELEPGTPDRAFVQSLLRRAGQAP